MTPLRQRTLDYMIIKGYAEATKNTYIQRLKLFALHYNCCPSQLEQSNVMAYLKYLSVEKKASQSTLSASYSAIKILFVNVLGKDWNSVKLPRPKRQKKLPVVLSLKQVQAIFEETQNLKHKTFLMLVYSAGLRVGEAHRMRVRDLLFSRKMLFVRQAKGAKDRYSILNDTVIKQLQLYLKVYRPSNWLFCGQNPQRSLTISSMGKIYQQAKRRTRIVQPGGIHQLRHCFATHMLEAGMDIFTLQRLLGHTSIRTTAIYLHLSDSDFSDFKHPLDFEK